MIYHTCDYQTPTLMWQKRLLHTIFFAPSSDKIGIFKTFPLRTFLISFWIIDAQVKFLTNNFLLHHNSESFIFEWWTCVVLAKGENECYFSQISSTSTVALFGYTETTGRNEFRRWREGDFGCGNRVGSMQEDDSTNGCFWRFSWLTDILLLLNYWKSIYSNISAAFI